MSDVISRQTLDRLIESWLDTGKSVLAPQKAGREEKLLYLPLAEVGHLVLDPRSRPRNTIKEAVFPRHEVLFRYRLDGKQLSLLPADPPALEQIVVGARPCDAAAFEILDPVFNWDYRDEHYNRRRELATVVTLACGGFDAHCFCTSVDGGPDDPRGSDAMLFDLGDGTYEVRCFSDKGRKLLSGSTIPSDRQGAAVGPPADLDLDAVGRFLDHGYEEGAWAQWALRCLGCGACAFACPTCHCFDMVDEGRPSAGARVRNWDACQFRLFTHHASGHNPRANQGQRQRQRIQHKFHIYPEKFGKVLCTGCGNCTRNCPVQLGVRPVLEAIAQGTNHGD